MFENDLHDAGIEWQRVVESVSPMCLSRVRAFRMYRRWVVLVRESDYERATQIAQERFYPVSNLVPFAGGGLCFRHGYEFEPCTGFLPATIGWQKVMKRKNRLHRQDMPTPFNNRVCQRKQCHHFKETK